MKDNKPVNRPYKGLSTDTSYGDQPNNTTTFVLNGVNETMEGDRGFISNEEANEMCHQLTTGYVPLGKVYIGDGNTLIFSVSADGNLSEIGVADRECGYTVIVNHDLGFKLSSQIHGIYRLRRGCEKVIYFVTPKLMYLNLNKLDNFKDKNGNWETSKFKLFRTHSSVPIFDKVTIEEGGNVPAGSYNAALQYLDEDLNPTEWITTSKVVKIYHDSVTDEYANIRGSSNKVTAYQDFGNTNKSIRFSFSNLDKDYPFYRVAIISATLGTGEISQVGYSQEIPTDIGVYNYTGNPFSEGTVEEILEFRDIIEEASHIEQIENKLILANTKGKQINFCKLQTYASRIKADMVTSSVVLNSLSASNPKNGLVDFGIKGYTPGEIRSFAIVYVFDDGYVSPAYHIPGKAPSTLGSSFAEGTFPMSVDNECEDTFYTDNSCGTQDYWGLDSEGNSLKNNKVRHHRFPTRNEVNKPLLVKGENDRPTLKIYNLKMLVSGNLSVSYTNPQVSFSVEYTVDGNTNIVTRTFSVDTYTGSLSLDLYSNSNEIIVDNIYENGAITNNPAPSGLEYTTSVNSTDIDNNGNLYTSEVFGIRFSNVVVPSLEDTNGEKVIGYYIVANEKDEDNKTVLDTGIMFPMLEQEFFVGSGHLMPNLTGTDRIKADSFALLHPEHKFNSREYTNISKISKEGEFIKTGNSSISNLLIQDTMIGTSFDPEVHKRRENDSDGFDLHVMVRDNQVDYVKSPPEIIAEGMEISEVIYLDALGSKAINDVNDVNKELFNVSADNKIGIVKLNKELNVGNFDQRLPYVSLSRELSNPYANFRVLPYYKQNMNPVIYLFDEQGNTTFGEEVNIFSGDSVITPIRYTSSCYYDIRIRNRATKGGLFSYILGVLAIVVGVVLTVFTAGASTALIAVGVAAVGLGISQISAGLKQDRIGKVWGELYEQGLRETIKDNDTNAILEYTNPDDEVQWFSDTVTNLWMESSVNMSIRQGTTVNIPDFLNAPADKSIITQTGIVNVPQNEVDSHVLAKLTNLDPERSDGRLYQGFANAELYEINPDYNRIDKEKIYTMLGVEYDCCSDCIETFSSRIHYSQDSFKEELTDNYRVFLPNNYRDIEGEHGEITNIYRFYNNIFIHTSEALWKLPQNFQERVTDEIVSFIGTGSYFNIPPQKITEGEVSSAGTLHKEGCMVTPYGILFPSSREGKWYLFDGNSLNPISDKDNSKWFRNNMQMFADDIYFKINNREFEFKDNPSNPIGTGYISTYDTNKERFIVTKKDYNITSAIATSSDFRLCYNDGVTIFNNYIETLNTRAAAGFTFEGIDNCRLKFSKKVTVTTQETRTQTVTVPNKADIVVYYDTSGSFTESARVEIKAVVDSWLSSFIVANPNWEGTLHHFETPSFSGERWLDSLNQVLTSPFLPYTTATLSETEIVLICFTNEATPEYHSSANFLSSIAEPTTQYINDFGNFKNQKNNLKSFKGISYPVVFSGTLPSKQFLQHQLAAFKGTNYNLQDVNSLSYNPAYTPAEWENFKTALRSNNPYPDEGLYVHGWRGIFDKYWDGNNEIINETEFADSIDTLLAGEMSTEEVIVDVETEQTIFEYEDGTVLQNNELVAADRSWTMSYSLKSKSWVSWHSYTPNFYFNTLEKFYGWKSGVNGIWKFNQQGKYQTYFDTYYPHIVEYVSLSSALVTKIVDNIMLQTVAEEYDFESKEYFERRYVTFNKLLVYNSRQISGLLDLIVKDTQDNEEDYLKQQITNSNDSVVMDRNERDWMINDLRDVRVNHNVPMFKKDIASVSVEYFIDKIVNSAAIDMNRDWSQAESFRDKYLVIRLIMDKFDNIRLITNYSSENETPSIR